MPGNIDPTSVHRSGTAAILGRPNVGKSTLLNAALREKIAIVTPTAQTTRDRILGVVRHGDAQIALIDTPGLHRPRSRLGGHMNASARDAARNADVVVFMTAVPKKPTAELKPHVSDVALLDQIDTATHIILVINKVDRLKNKSLLLPFVDAFSKIRSFIAIVPVSAKFHDGIEQLLDQIGAHLPTRGPVYDEDFLTDRPLRFLAAETIREQIILTTRQEIPHQVAVVIERFDESGRFVDIHATIFCARSGQKGIIIGKGGELIRDIGIDARKQLEVLLERQVNLKLWVRVVPGWMESADALRELGYTERDKAES